jgi:hypothetical protein
MWRIPQCVVTALDAVEITDVRREEVVDVLGPVVAALYALVDAWPTDDHTTTVLVCERGGDWVVERITATHYCYDGESHAYAPDAVARAAKSMGFAAATCIAEAIPCGPFRRSERDTLTLSGCPHVCDIASAMRNLLLLPKVHWRISVAQVGRHPAAAALPFKGVLCAMCAVGVIHGCTVSGDMEVITVHVGPSVSVARYVISYEGTALRDHGCNEALREDFKKQVCTDLAKVHWLPSGEPPVGETYSLWCDCLERGLVFPVCDM